VVLPAAVLVVVVAVLSAAALGSLTIPHNDAWAYSLIGKRFAETGSFELVGWNAAALWGQVVAAAPFTALGGVTGQHLFVAGTAVGLLLATFALVRRLAGERWATLAVATTLAFPGFLLLSTSFMTEVPATAAMVGCVLAGVVAMEAARQGRSPLPLLVASLLLGCWGSTVREQAIIAPLVVTASLAVAWRGTRWRAAAWVGMGTTVAVAIVFQVFRRSLSNNQSLSFFDPIPGPTDLRVLVLTALTAGLVLLPLTVAPGLLALRRRYGPLGTTIVLLVVAAAGLVMALVPRDLLIGNYLSPTGAYTAAASGQRPGLLPWWDLLPALGLLGLLTLGATIVPAWRCLRASKRPGERYLVLGFGLAYAASIAAQASVGWAAFDRYLLPLVAPGAALGALGWRHLRATTSPLPLAVTTGVVGLLAVTSAVLSLNAWAFDSARWQAGVAATADGWPTGDVDAGLEWAGWHSREAYGSGPPTEEDRSWWSANLPSSRSCVLVTSSREEGQVVAEPTYRLLGFLGPQSSMYVIVTGAGTCELTAPDAAA
jgi:uncharacterized membrane protein